MAEHLCEIRVLLKLHYHIYDWNYDHCRLCKLKLRSIPSVSKHQTLTFEHPATLLMAYMRVKCEHMGLPCRDLQVSFITKVVSDWVSNIAYINTSKQILIFMTKVCLSSMDLDKNDLHTYQRCTPFHNTQTTSLKTTLRTHGQFPQTNKYLVVYTYIRNIILHSYYACNWLKTKSD